MTSTPFPTRPSDVAALTVQEFAFDFGLNCPPSLDAVCRRFVNDANRAIVWCIRFRALGAWCAGADMAELREAGTAATWCVACEVAASFELNDYWEFDAEAFRSAVKAAVSSRSVRQ